MRVLARSEFYSQLYFMTAVDNSSFAYAEIRTASANILSRFDIERADDKKLDVRQYITMQFHDGSWNTFLTPRWKKAV